MKKLLTTALLLLLAAPALAQVDPTKIPADTPRLTAVIEPAILWGVSVLFSLLVLIMAFKAPKRNFYNPKI